MCLLIINDLVELGKDRVGDGMQLLRPEVPIAANALLGVLLLIFGAWQTHNQIGPRGYDYDSTMKQEHALKFGV